MPDDRYATGPRTRPAARLADRRPGEELDDSWKAHCPCDIHRHHESCHRCRGGERCPYRCECRCHCPAYKLRGEGGS